jgi:hypothetical protein
MKRTYNKTLWAVLIGLNDLFLLCNKVGLTQVCDQAENLEDKIYQLLNTRRKDRIDE